MNSALKNSVGGFLRYSALKNSVGGFLRYSA